MKFYSILFYSIAYIFWYFDIVHCIFINLLVYLYYSVDFTIVVLYCIAMQPGTIIYFGMNKVLSYLIVSYLNQILSKLDTSESKLLPKCLSPPRWLSKKTLKMTRGSQRCCAVLHANSSWRCTCSDLRDRVHDGCLMYPASAWTIAWTIACAVVCRNDCDVSAICNMYMSVSCSVGAVWGCDRVRGQYGDVTGSGGSRHVSKFKFKPSLCFVIHHIHSIQERNGVSHRPLFVQQQQQWRCVWKTSWQNIYNAATAYSALIWKWTR